MYGKEIIIDCCRCDRSKFAFYAVRAFFIDLCEVLKVERVGFHYCESEPGDGTDDNPKTNGISAVQFLVASSVTLHALAMTGELYVNVFTCGELDADQAVEVVRKHFNPEATFQQVIERGMYGSPYR